MKHILKISLLIIFLAFFLIFNIPLKNVNADAEPTTKIAGFNLAFEDNIYIIYYVKSTNTTSSMTQGVLVWEESQTNYNYENKDASAIYYGKKEINGVTYDAYYYNGISSTEFAKDVYAVSYVKVDDTYYYSTVEKYSVLQYIYNKLGYANDKSKKTTNTKLITLLEDTITYGASSQNYFEKNLDRLVSDQYYEITLTDATLEDGTNHGLYKAGDELVITPNETSYGEFNYLVDSLGNKTTNTTITVSKNDIYKISYDNYPTISYVNCDNLVGDAPTKLNYEISNKTFNLDNVYKNDYYFGGWYLSSTFEENTKVTSIDLNNHIDYVLYAKFNQTPGLKFFIGKDYMGIPEYYDVDDGSMGDDEILYIPDYHNDTKVTGIIGGGFINRSKIKTIYMGHFIEIISTNAFSGCRALTNIIYGDNLKMIDECAFDRCTSYKEVVIPDGVEVIEYGIFEDACPTYLVLPSSLSNVNYSFLDYLSTPAQVKIYYKGTEDSWNELSQDFLGDTAAAISEVRFYNERVHHDNEWSYVDGIISTDINHLYINHQCSCGEKEPLTLDYLIDNGMIDTNLELIGDSYYCHKDNEHNYQVGDEFHLKITNNTDCKIYFGFKNRMATFGCVNYMYVSRYNSNDELQGLTSNPSGDQNLGRVLNPGEYLVINFSLSSVIDGTMFILYDLMFEYLP